ncbi:MAG: pectate lyase, partial [Bacteroidota bacterium]
MVCRNRFRILLPSVMLLCVAVPSVFPQQLAFPGAEGGGMYTWGGRGGKVLEVTTLLDTTATNVVGTLRWAINQSGARTVVFRVSGTIALVEPLKITKDSITVAGQTAPGDGICLRNFTFNVSANQVIIRYIRSRFGDQGAGKPVDDAINGYSQISHNKKDIIVDHCSASWSLDESLSFYGYDSLTIQWCLISESLYNSYDPKGAHGYGGIWGGFNSTYHHNLFAHHSSRNPRFSGPTPAGSGTDSSQNLDFRNNVIYNWGFNSSYGGEESEINIVNNYYKYGPATKADVKSRIFNPYGSGDSTGTFYIAGNYVDGDTAVTYD